MDEARVGQQGTLTRVWAKRGTRPRAVRDRRDTCAHLLGAAPAKGPLAAPPEVLFMAGARVARHGPLPPVGARRGHPPPPVHDRRYTCAHLFGAVCPERGVGAAVVMPTVNIEAMS